MHIMRTLGLRDVIGPIMVGPSSSHTAGALRIALMTRQMLNARPREVEFLLYGSIPTTAMAPTKRSSLACSAWPPTTKEFGIRSS